MIIIILHGKTGKGARNSARVELMRMVAKRVVRLVA